MKRSSQKITIICGEKRESIRNGTSNIWDVTQRAYKEKRCMTEHEFEVVRANIIRMCECANVSQGIEELRMAKAELLRNQDG